MTTVACTGSKFQSVTYSSSGPQITPQSSVAYTESCASCHGPMVNTTKRGRTTAEIQLAITTVPSMQYLASLSVAQINAIAAELSLTAVAPMACNDPQKLLAPQLKRLTVGQFSNSLKNAFGDIFQDSQMPNLNDANPRLGLGSDPDHLNINEININALYDSTQVIVDTIRTRNSAVATCLSGTSTTCFTSLLQSFGPKLWRRPISALETADFNTGLTSITTAGGSRSNRIDYILKSLILSPDHLYRTELGSSATPATQIFSLTQYEIASLLAFTVWDSPPDDILTEQARLGALNSSTALKAQFTRMARDSRFAAKMASFAVDVLKIEDIKTVTKDASFAMTTSERGALYASARATLEETYAQPGADFMAPFRLERFHVNDLSARYWGMSAAGLSSSMTNVLVNPTQRFGILSHPAFLTSISGEVSSGIVRRGVYALEQLLCNNIGTPPPNPTGVNTLPPNWDPALVSSRVVLQVTHSAQTSCMGCHSKIDPAGFGFENYGPFGQYRTVEKANIPIDASGNISGASERPLVFANSVGYLHALAESATLRQCMNKHFFKHASGEAQATVSGQCEFANLEAKTFQKGNSVQALMESFIELESFTKRKPTGL